MQKYEIRLNSAYSSALFLSMKAAITRLLSLYRLIHSKTEQSKISFYRIIGPDTCQCFRNITCCFDTFTAFCQAQIDRNTMNVSIKWNNQFTGMKLLPDTKINTGIPTNHPTQKHTHFLGFGSTTYCGHTVDMPQN